MEPVVRWLLTYLLHSTLLLGLAALARIALRERRVALQEGLLRAALVGSFVTAGLQVGLDLRPLGGSLAMPKALAGPGSSSFREARPRRLVPCETAERVADELIRVHHDWLVHKVER